MLNLKKKINFCWDINLVREVRCRMKILEKALIITFFAVLIQACDDCKPINADLVEPDIYFSALPLNSDSPSIYGIKENRSNMIEIAENARIFNGANKGNHLYFPAVGNGNELNIFRSDQYGRSLTNLNKEDGIEKIYFTVFSESGGYKAYKYKIGDADKAFIEDISGFAIEMSDQILEATLPSFSPDGNHFAYYSYKGGFAWVKVVESNSLNIIFEEVFLAGVYELEKGFLNTITWSANGRYICFSVPSQEESVYELRLQNPRQGEITDHYSYEFDKEVYNPSVSPDITKIAYSSSDGNLWIFNRQDSTLEKITDNGYDYEQVLYPEWSPDSKKLLYIKYYIMPPANNYKGNMELYNFENKSTSILASDVTFATWTRNKD
jgi:Tol biopolymer transport system component